MKTTILALATLLGLSLGALAQENSDSTSIIVEHDPAAVASLADARDRPGRVDFSRSFSA